MMRLENNKGITLVALIVTIVVMLILAGMSLSIVLDDDTGVVKKAQEVVDKTKVAEEKEKIEMTWTGLYIEKTTITLEDLLEELGDDWSTDETDINIESGVIISPTKNKFSVDEDGKVNVVE